MPTPPKNKYERDQAHAPGLDIICCRAYKCDYGKWRWGYEIAQWHYMFSGN